ncbi:amine sulfotransferase-like isoform 1-T1 [Synchiropus picturatus]
MNSVLTFRDMNDHQDHDFELVPHKGFTLIKGTHDPDDVDLIHDLEVRDSDVFVVTYPKSGTIWMQQILLLIEAKGDVKAIGGKDKLSNGDLMPWLELTGHSQAFAAAPSPRLRVTHLPYHLMPAALTQRKGKVIYIARNPKDVLVSYFHFHKLATMLETPKSFDEFFEKFMTGDVYGCRWFEHIKTWYSHREELNMLFITYEEMIRDLRSSVRNIVAFLGKELTEEQLESVVKHSTFDNMRKMPLANYEQVPGDLLNHHQGKFMRKGKVGDWKSHFTVAQSETFDKVFQEEMKDFPLSFVWDTEG